jgi:hypothetical protein
VGQRLKNRNGWNRVYLSGEPGISSVSGKYLGVFCAKLVGKKDVRILQVGAGATVAAMTSFEQKEGSHDCESEKLLPVFHCEQ